MHVKLSSTLRRYVPDYNPENGLDIEINPGDSPTALDLATRLGLPPEEIKFVMLNGRYVKIETKLAPADRLAYFPAVGGG